MRLGFLADAHGNREAFEQGDAVLRAKGADAIYFLGDAVAYLPGDAVLDALRAAGATPVLGNHDAALLAGEVDARRDQVYRLGDTRRTVSRENMAYLATWPDHRYVDSPAGTLLLVHGSPTDRLGGYVYPDTDLAPFSATEAAFVFMAQTHRPFVRRAGRTTFVNVGSCGLPRDCGHLGAGCLFDTSTGEAEIVRFDIRDATAAALARCGPVAPEVLAVFARRSEDCDAG